MCFAFILFLISSFALTACFFFLFLYTRSKCEANVALLTEKKTHFLTRANGAIVLSP